MATTALNVSGERRTARRFPIELELDYRATGKQEHRLTGSGKTTNISSTGIHFRTEQELEPDISLEASICWPVRLDATVPLKLRVRGRVVRQEPGAAVLEIQQYDFYTARA